MFLPAHVKQIFIVACMTLLAAAIHWTYAQNPGGDLEQGFRNPPESAWPRTWWHWTNGNITKEGITKDLEWMKRAGIAGMQLADVSSGSGQTIDEKVEFGSPEWLDALRHAASEAQRLGLEMTIFSSPGWSETGGPWVKPERAMKKLVWSETVVDGPRMFEGKLPSPPSNNGPIRNLRTGGARGNAPPDPTYYGDSAVLAYRTPAAEIGMAALKPKATTPAGALDAAALYDDDLNSTISIPAPQGGGAAWVQFEFDQPFTTRAITLSGRGGIPVGRVLAGNDGASFRTIVTLPGRVVESAEISDRFLWDFRRTLADLWADCHFGVMTELSHQLGIRTYAEAAGVSLEIPEDTLLNKSKVDIPMGEFWVRDLHPRLMYYQDVRGAASAAHVYGKTLTAAESFTGGGYEAPYTLKRVGDYWLAQGINRIIFHTSAHQPLDTKPGNTMVGAHINRNITWAEQARPFMTYLARGSYMLQQGLFVADLAFLLNEGAPSTMPIWGPGLIPAPPAGYDYDYINADVLLNRMSVGEGGRLTLPDGMSYRVLVLPQTDRVRPELLQKIRELVAGGATVVGARPLRAPGLTNYPAADDAVQALASELWGDLDGVSRTICRYGKGMVVWGLPLDQILASLNVPKDFDYEKGLDADVAWLHRRSGETDIYYVANLTDRAQTFQARFRVRGKEAELWHPDTGEIVPAGYALAGDRTSVSLNLDVRQSVFVVFRKTSAAPARSSMPDKSTKLAELNGPWEVSFPPNLGAPAKLLLPELRSWTENADEGVKYFSGTATYAKVVEAPKSWFNPGTRLLLDLGTVYDLAEVSVNGQAIGLLWKPPYRVDVTRALMPGKNRLEIKITNQWTNRLLGDRSAPPEKRVLAAGGAAPAAMGATNQVLPASGLIGPVTLISK